MTSGRRDLRVLILEDNLFQRNVLAATLRSLGIRHVAEAGDGVAGLAALRASPEGFDLVITDLAMEGMDGLEFLRHAAQFGVGGLILCSGHDEAVLASAEWMARAYNAPLLGVIHKPLKKDALAVLIDKLDAQRTMMSAIFASGDPDMVSSEALEEIRDGLDTGQFIPFYQPKVSLLTGETTGVEVLARWAHPVRGTLAPVHFIDLMERFGMIEALTHSILDQACADRNAWTAAGCRVPFAINVSPLTMGRPDCSALLLARLSAAGISPDQFTVEITEQAFSQDPRALLENALRLRVHGCGVSVDDYGVGYSSLQQISRVPVTELKLDRSFIKHLPQDAKALSIVESTIALAKKLKLKTVAEGIETDEQRDCLRDLQCDVGQGYLFARPMPRDAFIAWQAERRLHPA